MKERRGRDEGSATGSAGFIGTAIGELLEAAGNEVVRVDRMLDSAHGARPQAPHHLDVREAASSDNWCAFLARVDAGRVLWTGPNPLRTGMFSPAKVQKGECKPLRLRQGL